MTKLSKMEKLTREEAIERVGLRVVEKVEAESALQSGLPRSDGLIELIAKVSCIDKSGVGCDLSATRLIDADDVRDVKSIDDLQLGKCDHYTIDDMSDQKKCVSTRTQDTIIVKAPLGTKARWVHLSQKRSLKLNDWLIEHVERSLSTSGERDLRARRDDKT